jgi:hypothetical protein
LAPRFQKRVARSSAAAWLLATSEDLRYPTTRGARPDPATRLLHRYLDQVITAATVHPGVNRAFLDVVNLAAPPTTLLRPVVLLPSLVGPSRAGPG